MTRIATTTARRTLDYLEWVGRANEALRTPTDAAPAETPRSERTFRAVHAHPRYRARLYL